MTRRILNAIPARYVHNRPGGGEMANGHGFTPAYLPAPKTSTFPELGSIALGGLGELAPPLPVAVAENPMAPPLMKSAVEPATSIDRWGRRHPRWGLPLLVQPRRER